MENQGLGPSAFVKTHKDLLKAEKSGPGGLMVPDNAARLGAVKLGYEVMGVTGANREQKKGEGHLHITISENFARKLMKMRGGTLPPGVTLPPGIEIVPDDPKALPASGEASAPIDVTAEPDAAGEADEMGLGLSPDGD